MPPARLAHLVVVIAACGSSASGAPRDGGVTDARVDARTTCAGGEPTCDVFLSCSCQPAEKCTPVANGLGCATAGTKQVGEVCDFDVDCGRGSLCAPYAGQTTCLAFCDEVHPCGSGRACYIVAADLAGRAQAQVCGPTCTLLAQDCPGGIGCYPSDRNLVPERGICLAAGGGHQSATCTSMSDCAKGYACIAPPNLAPRCAKICDRTGGVPSCDQGSTCQPLSGDSQTGVCLP